MPGACGALAPQLDFEQPRALAAGTMGGRGSQLLPAETAGKEDAQCRHLGL